MAQLNFVRGCTTKLLIVCLRWNRCQQLFKEKQDVLPVPDYLITSVGTEVSRRTADHVGEPFIEVALFCPPSTHSRIPPPPPHARTHACLQR